MEGEGNVAMNKSYLPAVGIDLVPSPIYRDDDKM